MNPESVHPLHDYVLVKRVEADTLSPGGIIIPEQAKEKPQHGIVLAAGPGRILDDGTLYVTTVKVGDHVLFAKYGGSEIKTLGENLLIMHEGEILATITENEDAS